MALTTEEFIERSRKVHGDKYDYSKVEYVNNRTKVCIICPTHGEFYQEPISHMNGFGCAKCNNRKRLTTEEFVEHARMVHGDKYDYSKVDYKNNQTKVCITCKEHGDFFQTPLHHLGGHGCPKCNGGASSSTEEFIEKAKNVHGDRYGYSRTQYKNYFSKVTITCVEHGDFLQFPGDHLRGCGCPRCKAELIGDYKRMTQDEFVKKATEVHHGKYDYGKTVYVNSSTKTIVTCKEHGEFRIAPSTHLQGIGCPICNASKLEIDVAETLKNDAIEFKEQCRRDTLCWLGRLSLDFYIPKYNVAIECQGIQHFKPIGFFGGEKAFNSLKERDETKRKLCEQHGVTLLYFARDTYGQENIITQNDKLLEEIHKHDIRPKEASD